MGFSIFFTKKYIFCFTYNFGSIICKMSEFLLSTQLSHSISFVFNESMRLNTKRVRHSIYTLIGSIVYASKPRINQFKIILI